MPYLIDGHNLIPKISGLSLDRIDDEMQLVEILQAFCRLSRKQAEVFFDNAPPGQPSVRTFGSVVAHFVRQGQTADLAIRRKLKRLGRGARNWTVVSSDRAVQAMARGARAQVLSSEDFAAEVEAILASDESAEPTAATPSLSPSEVEEWLRLFESKGKK